MGAAGFIGLGLIILLSLPSTAYNFAKRMGRNPKLWFLIGFLLPGIAIFILFFLPDLSEPEKENTQMLVRPNRR